MNSMAITLAASNTPATSQALPRRGLARAEKDRWGIAAAVLQRN